MEQTVLFYSLPESWEPEDVCSRSERTRVTVKRTVNDQLIDCEAVQCMLGKLTETCPDRTLGLMGDVTEMDGPTF